MKVSNLTKQQLAQKRNYFKFVLTGLRKPINPSSLTEEELNQWHDLLKIRGKLLDNFDNASRILGLNVPEHKCWCGKAAKQQADYYDNGELVWVCNKHKTLE